MISLAPDKLPNGKRQPRAEGLYVCAPCRADPCMRREMGQARRRSFRNLDERQWLVAECGWKGGWGKSS